MPRDIGWCRICREQPIRDGSEPAQGDGAGGIMREAKRKAPTHTNACTSTHKHEHTHAQRQAQTNTNTFLLLPPSLSLFLSLSRPLSLSLDLSLDLSTSLSRPLSTSPLAPRCQWCRRHLMRMCSTGLRFRHASVSCDARDGSEMAGRAGRDDKCG